MLILIVTALASGATSNPLAPALAGKVECSSPDKQRRTCKSIASYRHLTGATYSNTATILISKDQPIALETTSLVTLKGDQVCGTLKREDLQKAKIWAGGHALAAAEATAILERLSTAMSSMIGKEICVRYEVSASGIVEHGTIEGTPKPTGDEAIEWISPADGYIVAP